MKLYRLIFTRRLFAQHRNRRELQRISDNFGFGTIIRYGDDRWGRT